MDLHNNPNLGTDLLEVKIRQVEDKIKIVTQDVGNIQNEVDSLHDDFDAQNVTVHTLATKEPIPSDNAVGFDRDGKLIPIDVAAGTAKWKSVEARQNIISPKDNADVLIDTSLTLENTVEETMTDTVVLALDENGKVVKKDASETLQKKLVPGYNISIDEQTQEISCDIKTMTFKGSVATVDDLPPTGNTTGDVWNITTTNQNYCWDGESWIVVGSSVDLTNYYTKTQTDSKISSEIISAILNKIYPVGSIKISENNVNPGTYIPGTTWIQTASGRVLEGADENHTGGTTIEAGIPNSTGELYSNSTSDGVNFLTDGGNAKGTGGLKITRTRRIQTMGNTGTTSTLPDGFGYDLNKGELDTDGNLKTDESSKVYGKSNTVQMAAHFVYFWKRTA